MSRPKSAYVKDAHQAQGLTRKLPTGLVCARYNISDTTLRRWARDTRLGFPQPFQISEGGVNFYDAAELDAFDERRAALAPAMRERTGARRKAEFAERRRRKAAASSLTAAPEAGDAAAAAETAEQHMSVQHARRPS